MSSNDRPPPPWPSAPAGAAPTSNTETPSPSAQPAPPGAPPWPSQPYGQPPSLQRSARPWHTPEPSMWSAPQGLAQVPQPHANPTAPAQSIGLFGAVPCPYCGQPTTVGSGGAGAAAGYAGGLVGALLVHAFAGKHYCSTHGQVPSTAFPPQHRTMILARKVALVGTAVLVLLAVTVLLAVLRS